MEKLGGLHYESNVKFTLLEQLQVKNWLKFSVLAARNLEPEGVASSSAIQRE